MATTGKGIATAQELKNAGPWNFQNSNSLQTGYVSNMNICPTLSQMQACDNTTSYTITYPNYASNQLVPYTEIKWSSAPKLVTLTINHSSGYGTDSYVEPYVFYGSRSNKFNNPYFTPLDMTHSSGQVVITMNINYENWPSDGASKEWCYYFVNSSNYSEMVLYFTMTSTVLNKLRAGTSQTVYGYVTSA